MVPGTQQDAEESLCLHAELLPNIRQITLYVCVPASAAAAALNRVHPVLHLSESHKSVTVSLPPPFEHVVETIKLPARVGDASRRVLDNNTSGYRAAAPSGASQEPGASRDYSFRLPIDPDEDEALVSPNELIDDYVPWTAGDMSPSTRIRCRECGNVLLAASKSTVSSSSDAPESHNLATGWIWKDLPSGNWAEMMDFWHCHKPDAHEDHSHAEASSARKVEGQNAQVKGYGPASRVEATPGTVLVDVASFLLAESDCVGLKKKNNSNLNSPPSKRMSLECDKCSTLIGMEDAAVNGWRLLKATVSVNTSGTDPSTESTWQTHPTEMIIAAQLLELIERESARRFVVHCGQKSGLLIWVFNPDLRYSNSSTGHSIMAQPAMKVFYQETVDLDKLLSPDLGKATPLSVEELELPSMVFRVLHSALNDTNQMLPVSARTFNDWQVGLLSRFRRDRAA